MTEEEPKHTPGTAIYLGKMELASGDEGCLILFLTEEEYAKHHSDLFALSEFDLVHNPRARPHRWKVMKKYLKAPPGSLYRINHTENTIQPGTAQYLGMWPNVEQRVCLQAMAEARERLMTLRKNETKAKVDEGLVSALDPIREAYWKAMGPARHQIIAMVVEYITTHKSRIK